MEQQIVDIINETIEDFGFELVKVTMSGGERKILEIVIDKQGEGSVNLGDCRRVSRDVSAVLDVENIISGKYFLEVSSAGAERPLVKITDYQKFSGRVVKIHLKQPIADKFKYKGSVIDVQGNLISLELTDNYKNKSNDKEIIEIDFDNIKRANLVFTDEMFKKIMNK